MSEKKLHLFAITWPIFIENLLMVLMSLFGLWLASRISTGMVAAYGLVNQILGALQIVFQVVSIGTSVVVTQHHGAGDEAGAHRVAQSGLAASGWVGLATLLLLLSSAGWILAAMNLPPELRPAGETYTRWLGLALLFDAVSMCMIAVLRAYTHTRESMKIVLGMNLLQVLLSVPLMLGVGRWPGLGLNGLALAMAVSRLFGIALAWRVWRSRLEIHLRLPDWLRLERVPLASILHIGLPGAGEKVAFRASFIISVAIVASMGEAALATHAYVWNAVRLVTLLTGSIGFGTEIVVGHHVGAGRLHRANRVLWQAMAWGMAVMLLCTLASWWLTPLAVARATANPEILALVGMIVLIELVLEPGRAFNIVMTSGLRAAGDARFPVKVSMVSVFLFGVGLGWLLGVHYGLGLVGVWIGYAADECCRGIMMATRWRLGGWVAHARRTRRRILAHMQA
ncbi:MULTISPECIES: MATE family efflux transporter [unclassified Uliginosibacterium]|uniref:MATE family efflux transporter n=1 Tax=unclassified Uliginosibacterium TaxID=2621521 RepID=UPI000C7D71E8|nr:MULTISPECIES: MATE family efflux transporter [unclassified Uliginosibacterium]MDO6385669.1 MATE family efflux transporter [Uliginosibacterium sp. 31-12]PLK47634.1 MATE family efflux transporter [Uliginosibacterium sp. TH139]